MEKCPDPLKASNRDLLNWTLKVLREYGLKPRKKLSQNFIVDPFLAREIVSYVDPGEHALEIGCGIGTLSKALLSKARSLLCIEIDRRLCEVASKVVNDWRFMVINGDARNHPCFRKVVVSNMPYHITSDILVKISRENGVFKAVLTVQKEVVDRLLARPGSKSYGKLTILINTLFTVIEGGVYPSSSFYPRPEVSSQVVVLTRKRHYTGEIRVLERITKVLFSQRKRLVEKALMNALGVKLSELGSIAGELEGKRVFMLGPEVWLEMSRALIERGIIQVGS